MSEQASMRLLTPTFTMYYPTIIEPREYQEKGKPKGKPTYSNGMILEKGDLALFKQPDEDTGELMDVKLGDILMKIAGETWPDVEDLKTTIKHGGIFWPIRAGAKVAEKKGKHAEYLDGKFLINTSSGEDYPPAVKAMIDGKMTVLSRGLPTDEKTMKSLFVGGNYAFAEVNVKGTTTPQGKFLKLYLNAICFVKTGERIGGGGGSLMDQYAGVSGGEADVDPTEGMDDEIPF